jgi:hypothetical protein
MIAEPLIHYETDQKIVKDEAYWEQRFWNPEVMMRWKSEIAVEPADRDRGRFHGTRIFPNGTKETFHLNL